MVETTSELKLVELLTDRDPRLELRATTLSIAQDSLHDDSPNCRALEGRFRESLGHPSFK